MLILIVDSSIPVIERLIALVTENGPEIHSRYATSFEEALLLLDQFQPDVVLLDMSLPDNSSVELLRIIKNKKAASQIVALSNSADEEVERQCRIDGASYFFDKYHDYENPGCPGSHRFFDRQ